MQITKIYIMKT